MNRSYHKGKTSRRASKLNLIVYFPKLQSQRLVWRAADRLPRCGQLRIPRPAHLPGASARVERLRHELDLSDFRHTSRRLCFIAGPTLDRNRSGNRLDLDTLVIPSEFQPGDTHLQHLGDGFDAASCRLHARRCSESPGNFRLRPGNFLHIDVYRK